MARSRASVHTLSLSLKQANNCMQLFEEARQVSTYIVNENQGPNEAPQHWLDFGFLTLVFV